MFVFTLISACTLKSGHAIFNDLLDHYSKGDHIISDLENDVYIINDVYRKSTLIKKESTENERYIKFYYGRPANAIWGYTKHNYGNTTCRYHFIVDVATNKIVDWGYDMKEGDLGYDLCRTYK